MSCENIFKDICHSHARLFDHRSALQGHTNFFLKEFEEKRGDREKTRLDHIQDAVCQATAHTLPTVQSQCSDQLTLLAQRIKQATERCQQVAEQETEAEHESEFLQGQREARQAELNTFMEQQCTRSAQVDTQFQANVQLFQQSHQQLRQQLLQGLPLTTQDYYQFMALGNTIS